MINRISATLALVLLVTICIDAARKDQHISISTAKATTRTLTDTTDATVGTEPNNSKEVFYFDVDHDFGELHDMHVRSDIPLVNRVSMLTSNNTNKKDDLADDNNTSDDMPEELDDSDDDDDNDDSEAQQNVDYFNDGVSGASSEGDDESDEGYDENGDESNSDGDRRMQTSQYTTHTGSNRDQSADSWGSSSQGQDDTASTTSDSTAEQSTGGSSSVGSSSTDSSGSTSSNSAGTNTNSAGSTTNSAGTATNSAGSSSGSSTSGSTTSSTGDFQLPGSSSPTSSSSSTTSDNSMADSSADLNSGPDFSPTSDDEEAMSDDEEESEEGEGDENEEASDEDDDDDEEESFDNESDDDNDAEPAENDGGDFDTSDDGSEDDLENEEEEEEIGGDDDDRFQYDDDEDVDDAVLDQDSQDEEDNNESSIDNDDDDDNSDEEITPDAREVNDQLLTGPNQNVSTSTDQLHANGTERGFGMRKMGRKIFRGGRKIFRGGRKILRAGGRKIWRGGKKIIKGGRVIWRGGKKVIRKIFGGRRIKMNKHRFHKHGRKGLGKIKFRRKGYRVIRIKMGKKFIRLPGRRIRFKQRAPMKISLLKTWDWRRYIRGFKYEMVGKANIGFLVDGRIKKHLPMLQRWIANLIFLFARGSYISVGTYGGSVNVLNQFKTFSAFKEVKSLLMQLKPLGGGRKIGEALEFYYPLFKAVRGKSGMKKSILFLFATGKTTGDRKKLREYGIKYRKINCVIFVFGLGSRISISQFSSFTPRTRVMSAINYKAVILGGMGLRLGYRPGMRRSIFIILKTRLQRWLGMKVGVASKVSLHHHGHSHREWWFRKWDWYRYLGIRYGSLGRANLAFVIDGTNAELIMFLQRYVYNIIRLFQQQGTYVSILEYGRNQYINTKWTSFTSAQAIQTQCASIPFIKTRSRNTAAALIKMFKLYKFWLGRPNAPKIPNILFLLCTGMSTDRLKFLAIGKLYRTIGIQVWTIGIGPEGRKVANELRYLATMPRYALSGDMASLVQKAAFTMVSGGLLKIVGAGNAMQYIVGNPGMIRIQMKWNWRIGMRSIRYGYLSRANIGILVDGIQPKNFGFVRRFVYNLIRMYSLSGTYVSLMVYGSKVYRVSNFVQLRTPMDIRRLVMKMPKVANGARRTGAALQAMLQGFGDAPPGNPNILYLITQGPSADPVTSQAAAFRKFGIKAFAAGIGPMASPKELATIAFSSATIFKSGPNGMVHTLNNMQQASASIIGTVSKSCGKSGHTRCRKQDIVKQWQWKTYGISFSYASIKKASIMFLIDGTNTHHFDVLQKLAYNIYKLFATGTSVSIITFGGTTDMRLAMYRTFTDVTAFQTYLSAMTYRGDAGRKIGASLATAVGIIGKAPAGKKVLFLFATGPSDDDVTGPAKAMVNKGVSIFALGIGKDAKGAEMKKISRYYLTTRWKGLLFAMVKIQNSLGKVCGKMPKPPDVGPQPDAPPGDPAKKPPLPVPTTGYIASSAAQPIGLLQTNWDWFKLMKIIPQGLNAANVVILLDVSKKDNWDIVQRFIAQLIAMFKYKDTEFTLVTFSDKPMVTFQKKSFANFEEAKTTCKTIEPRLSRKVKTGKALMFVNKNILPSLLADKTKVAVLFLITRTKSSDDVSKGAEQMKGSGCKGVGIGVGTEISQEELGMIALNGQLGLSGPVTSLPAIIIRILFGLTTIVNGPPPTPVMSLTTMAGKNGPALAGGVMNSVQTSSVPSETAGQPGTPNTGASAGDASGADTGGGGAGAPEQGGSTNPSGKPEVAPAANPPAGGPEAGGGETGAGGTDVSAGGGAAGATEAASGQSKQDGGPGGPGDGSVSNGDSSKPTNPDGTPAAAPVKPDGTPVAPTNPDGSPGVGPANPDGTPANPPADTNPDGTPATKPDGSPVEPTGGAAPASPESPTKPTKPNPDGSTTTDNPDGSKTTTKPDGSSTTTNPDGSATTTQPDGTTLNKKPDGTVTTTTPDGTTSTSKVPPNANPDGTAPAETPASTTTNPDGSTTATAPDGTKIETQPDGTTSETKPDGTTTNTKPDGSATTTKPDGTTMEKQPDGTVTTTKPDGSVTAGKVAPNVNPDGTPKAKPSADPSATTGEAPAAAPAAPTAPGVPSTNPDGSTTTTNPDGSATTTKPNGAEVQTQPDGSKTEKKPDGTTTTTQPDGSATTTKPDGTKMEKSPDGTVTTTNPDGSTSTSNVDPGANPDGSTPETAPQPTGGTAPVSNPDGSTTTTNPDGSGTTTKPNGAEVETKPDGSKTEKKPDGTTTTTQPDGSATTTKPDGTKLEKSPDGTVTTTNPDGSTSTSSVDPSANPDGSAPEPAPPAPAPGQTGGTAPVTPTGPVTNPDGSTTTTNPDGSSTTKTPSGTEIETKPDGSKTEKKPDGTTTTTQPDGSASTTKPDGTKLEKSPDGTVTTTNPDGSTSTSNVAPDANPDGSTPETTPAPPAQTGGTAPVAPTGPVTNPDGSTTTKNPDGSSTTKKPDGTTTTTQPDGSASTTKPDGTKLDKKPDGTVTTTNPDGSTTTSNVAPNANPDGSPTPAPPAASGPAAGGCQCPTCPAGCVPVVVTCQPKQKNCVSKQRKVAAAPKSKVSTKDSSTGLTSEDKEINAVQKLLEEFYEDDTSTEDKNSSAK